MFFWEQTFVPDRHSFGINAFNIVDLPWKPTNNMYKLVVKHMRFVCLITWQLYSFYKQLHRLQKFQLFEARKLFDLPYEKKGSF